VVASNFDKFRRSRDGNGPLRWTIRATPGIDTDIISEPFQEIEAMIALIAARTEVDPDKLASGGMTPESLSKRIFSRSVTDYFQVYFA
jgi:hypothetical protein